MSRFIEIGETYGCIHVDKISDKPYMCYDCTCLKCGNEFVANGHVVFNYAKTGCGLCIRKQKAEQEANKYINMVFGELKVINFAGYKPAFENSNCNHTLVTCLCLKCGSSTDMLLTRLKSSRVKECVHCARKNLSTGREITKAAGKKGTSALCISNRAKNKNNTSGHNGVSWVAKISKWRAYINFQRKQYHLGLYDDLQDAVSAPKTGGKRNLRPVFGVVCKNLSGALGKDTCGEIKTKLIKFRPKIAIILYPFFPVGFCIGGRGINLKSPKFF